MSVACAARRGPRRLSFVGFGLGLGAVFPKIRSCNHPWNHHQELVLPLRTDLLQRRNPRLWLGLPRSVISSPSPVPNDRIFFPPWSVWELLSRRLRRNALSSATQRRFLCSRIVLTGARTRNSTSKKFRLAGYAGGTPVQEALMAPCRSLLELKIPARRAAALTGLSRATANRQPAPPGAACRWCPRTSSAPLSPPEFVDLAPMQVYTKLPDQEIYLESLSTFCRVLEASYTPRSA